MSFNYPPYSYAWTSAATFPTNYSRTLDSNIDGSPSNPSQTGLPRQGTPLLLQKPLPPTPTSEYDETAAPAKVSTPKLKSSGTSSFTGVLRNVRRVASWRLKTKGTKSEDDPKPRKAKKSRTSSPPRRIIYAEKGTQTSFEYLPATAIASRLPPNMHSWQNKRVRTSSEEEMPSARQSALPMIAETVAHDKHLQSRPSYRNLRSFLDTTSPSQPGTPSSASPAESNRSFMSLDVATTMAQTKSTPPTNLNLDSIRPKPQGSASSIKTIVRKESSNDTTGTYDSYYSDPLPLTPHGHPSSGMAVTEQGIIDRPIINRRSASETTADERQAKHPAHKRESSETSEPSSTASTPTGKLPKVRPGHLISPPRSRQQLARQTSSQRFSPLRNMQLLSPNPDSRYSLNQHQRPMHLPLPITPSLTAAQMNELDKPSPVIFRRPVEGYFAIPPVDVHEPPDHMEGSMLCPLHPEHRGGQKTWCTLHGRLSTANDTAGSKIDKAGTNAASSGSDNQDSSNALEQWTTPSVDQDSSSQYSSQYSDLEDLNPYRSLIARRSPLRSPHSPRSPGPRSPGLLGDLGASTGKAARVLMGNDGLPVHGDGSRFELSGPDHKAGDAMCPAWNGRGICVWHGRAQPGTVGAAIRRSAGNDSTAASRASSTVGITDGMGGVATAQSGVGNYGAGPGLSTVTGALWMKGELGG